MSPRSKPQTRILHSDLRQHFRKDGTAKKSFATQSAALRFAETLPDTQGIVTSIYVCSYCRQWHTGRGSVS